MGNLKCYVIRSTIKFENLWFLREKVAHFYFIAKFLLIKFCIVFWEFNLSIAYNNLPVHNQLWNIIILKLGVIDE